MPWSAVTEEEDQLNTSVCSHGTFIWHYDNSSLIKIIIPFSGSVSYCKGKTQASGYGTIHKWQILVMASEVVSLKTSPVTSSIKWISLEE